MSTGYWLELVTEPAGASIELYVTTNDTGHVGLSPVYPSGVRVGIAVHHSRHPVSRGSAPRLVEGEPVEAFERDDTFYMVFEGRFAPEDAEGLEPHAELVFDPPVVQRRAGVGYMLTPTIQFRNVGAPGEWPVPGDWGAPADQSQLFSWLSGEGELEHTSNPKFGNEVPGRAVANGLPVWSSCAQGDDSPSTICENRWVLGAVSRLRYPDGEQRAQRFTFFAGIMLGIAASVVATVWLGWSKALWSSR